MASGTAFCAKSTKENISIDDKSLGNVPEPIKCYSFLGEISGYEKMSVGHAVQLCAGTKTAKAKLDCYKMAFDKLGLNRGLAVELCGEGRKLQ